MDKVLKQGELLGFGGVNDVLTGTDPATVPTVRTRAVKGWVFGTCNAVDAGNVFRRGGHATRVR